MAYFDHIEADRKRKAKEKYEELRKHLRETKTPGFLGANHMGFPAIGQSPNIIDITKYAIAEEHIQELEAENNAMRKRLEAYQDFFKTLGQFLPDKNEFVRLGN